MKITDFAGWLVSALRDEDTTATELLRALREQSSHFDPDPEKYPAFDPAVLRARTGPGGGIDADPFRAGFVLVAMMLDGPKATIASRVWRAWHLSQEGSVLGGWGDDWKPTVTTCELTGAHLFGDALKKVLGDEDLARQVDKVRIAGDRSAEIFHENGKVSRFEGHHSAPPLLTRFAEVSGMVIADIASILKPAATAR